MSDTTVKPVIIAHLRLLTSHSFPAFGDQFGRQTRMPFLNRDALFYPFFVLYRIERDLALMSLLVAEKASSNDITP